MPTAPLNCEMLLLIWDGLSPKSFLFKGKVDDMVRLVILLVVSLQEVTICMKFLSYIYGSVGVKQHEASVAQVVHSTTDHWFNIGTNNKVFSSVSYGYLLLENLCGKPFGLETFRSRFRPNATETCVSNSEFRHGVQGPSFQSLG